MERIDNGRKIVVAQHVASHAVNTNIDNMGLFPLHLGAKPLASIKITILYNIRIKNSQLKIINKSINIDV